MAKPIKVPANKNGLPYGSYVSTPGGPGRVVGRSDANLTLTEVWGMAHETGDNYTRNCRVITKANFEAKGGGTDTYDSRLKAWDAQQTQS